MKKRKSKLDFFDDMVNYKERRFYHVYLLLSCIGAFLLASCIIIMGLILGNIIFQQWVIVVMLILTGLAGYSCILILAVSMLKNCDDFAAGKFSRGMANLVMLFFFAALIVVILIVVLPEKWQSIIPAIIAAMVAILGAVLAIMGVHYTETKKREARRYNNKLIFSIVKNSDEAIEYKLEREINYKNISLCLNNISDNYGSFHGVYRIEKCGIFQMGDNFKYASIAPKTSYNIKGISYKEVNDQFILVYKDIEDIYYYLHCQVLSSRKIEIIKDGICDINYVRMRIKETTRMR